MWGANNLSFCRVTCSTNEFTELVYRISQQTAVSAQTWEQRVPGWGGEHPELTRKGDEGWRGPGCSGSGVPSGAEPTGSSLFPFSLSLC